MGLTRTELAVSKKRTNKCYSDHNLFRSLGIYLGNTLWVFQVNSNEIFLNNCVTLLPKFILHFDTKVHLGYNGFLNAFRPSTFCTENGGCRTHWNVELKNGPAVKEHNTDKFTLFLKNFILRETLVIWYWSIEEQVALSIWAEERIVVPYPSIKG